IQMLAAIAEDQTVETCSAARFTQEHALRRPVQPAPQARHGPAQLAIGSQYSALIAHPPQTTTPVLHLKISNLGTSLQIDLYHPIVQSWQVSTARHFFFNKGDLALGISN